MIEQIEKYNGQAGWGSGCDVFALSPRWPSMPHDQTAYEQAKREMEQGKLEPRSLLRRAQEIKEQLQGAVEALRFRRESESREKPFFRDGLKRKV